MRIHQLCAKLSTVLLIIILCGCSPCINEEVARIKSPDGKVDVVHIRGNCGATTSYTENIFLVPTNGKAPEPKGDNQLFLADHTNGLKAVWREPKVLEIHYDEARIFKFTNFWHSKDIDNFSYVIEVRLVPSKGDFSLSKSDRWIE